MKHSRHIKVLVGIAAFAAAMLASGTAIASYGHPSPSTGYFNGGYDSGSDYGHLIQNGLFTITGDGGVYATKSYTIPTKQKFVDFILKTLGNQTQFAGATQDQIGAAFIIQTMRYSPNGVTDRTWPSASDKQDWANGIIYNPDIVLDIKLSVVIPNGHNSGYSNSLKDDAWIVTNATSDVLVFKSNTTGETYYMLKINCANAVGDMPGLPIPPPKITGLKMDTAGNTSGPYKDDAISATSGGIASIPTSDKNNPFNLTVQAGTTTVTAADAITGWKVTGYSYIPCNTSAGGGCVPAVSGNGNSAPLTTKNGYTYNFKWVYQAIQPVKIVGYKIDQSNGTSGSFSSDTISAGSVNGTGGTVSSSAQPFNLSVGLSGNTDSIIITAGNSGIGNWTVAGYTYCDAGTSPPVPSCNNTTIPTANTPLLIGGSTANFPVTAGHTYYMRWVYKPGTPPTVCPSLPNPLVAVSLPDQTPGPQTPPPAATTIANNPYFQYTPQNKTNVTSVQDISAGGNRLLSILNLKSQSYQQAILDYSPYVKGYPYDFNQGSVTYDSYYTVTPWVSALSPSYYTCPTIGGSTVTGPDANHKCTVTTTSTSTTSYTGTLQTTSTTTWTCRAGDFGGGTSPTCIHFYVTGRGQWRYTTYTGTPSTTTTTTYGCNPGDSGGGSSPTCYHTATTSNSYTISATAWYNYTAKSSYTDKKSNTVNATLMSPCYNRSFSVAAINSASANISLNSNENPSSAMPSGYTLSVKFSYPAGYPTPTQTPGLRQKMQANLKYSYKFYKNSNPNSPQICSTNNQSFNVGGSLSPGPSIPDPYTIPAIPCAVSVGLAATQLAPGDQVCAIYSVSPTGSLVDVQGNIVTSNGGTVSSGEKCSGHVVNEPYFKVFGGDVSAGSAFATTSSSGAVSCSGNASSSTAGVYGWNTAADSVYSQHYAGSGAQYAVTAPNVILGVASNQNNTNANPSSGASPNPLGLSFSNMTNNNSPAGQFGGSLNASACITDFYSSLPATGVSTIGSGSLSGLNGKYIMTGGSTIAASDLGSGQRVTIYATGNIFIDGNITFPGGYTSVDQIPSLILIVKGNIYISNNVKNLTGVYIAQPTTNSSSDGYIYDCATATGLPVSSSSLYNSCDNQLVVNGSFIANKVVLMRSGIAAPGNPINSSLRGSSTAETNASNSPAEIFNYGPAFWMNLALPQATATGTSSAGYDSIISLPPIL